MENNDESLDGLIPRRSPERRLQDLVEGLAELRLTPWGLVQKLEKFGDDRPSRAILRSIERMISGETKVSAEMSVIMSMLLRQHRRLNERYADLRWEITDNGTHHAQIDSWHVYLTPQTRGRWLLSCAAGPERQDYSPPWGHWLDSFELAKHKALVEVEEGMNEFAEIKHEHRQRETS
ncbi:hypothetical protein PhaeoP75_04474 (plasmid) [Phaeobacter gallaeciensis]|uniref:Uncharacterized protein n=1 Tax=Phaeobacter gallaeciensis TaxID=60890 RepID=A0AAC9ZDL8_9RHOB|nr:hypothetical protein [Phaeobacter gallaeciensis]ATF04073.1 hypothetical protein PhaeoP75_04474 [Phaeobacter gallaeciensis]ATF08349.1 hypothetical protein PhaeoP63_04319 [Phaeobacter gallaeciensis]